MSGKRISYQNWIVELGRDPDQAASPADDAQETEIAGRRGEIGRRVKAALDTLEEDEREFIIRFHFMGEGYRSIAEKSGRSIHKLEALHKRSLRKLRKCLYRFVDETFELIASPTSDCPICRSPRAPELDEIIRNRDRRATWRPIIRLFRTKFDLHIGSPQLLIGHEKYHRI